MTGSRDALFCGGPVITMDDGLPRADYVLVRDDRIVEVGVADSSLECMKAGARIVQLDGRALVPGFIDAHNHFSLAALEPRMVDCRTPPSDSLHAVLEAIRRHCEHVPLGAWVRGWGFHASQVREARNPTRWELDEVSPRNPLFLADASFHAAYANSAALSAAGLDGERASASRGRIERDERGRPTGTLLEGAVDVPHGLSVRDVLARAPDQGVGLVAEAARKHVSLGVTAVADALVTPDSAELYRYCSKAGALPLTVIKIHGGPTFFAKPRLDHKSVAAMHEDDAAKLRTGGIKVFMDPAYPSPAVDRPCGIGCVEHVGRTNYSAAEVEQLVLAAAAADLDVVIHCGGNRAVEYALAAFAAVRRRYGSKGVRLRIEHAFIAHASQAARMADLGVSLVAQPGLGAAYGKLFDEWRGSDDPNLLLFPGRTMVDRGVTVAASSDNPCGGPLDPLEIMRCAVTRESYGGGSIEPGEAVTPTQALGMYTIQAARACGLDDEQGSISPGKQANLVVLSSDPTRSSAELQRAQVVETYVDGRLVHPAARPLQRPQ